MIDPNLIKAKTLLAKNGKLSIAFLQYKLQISAREAIKIINKIEEKPT